MSFSDQLLGWYDQQGRKDLPWQRQRSPYAVWLSEIMLQQTQVKAVIPYFERFMARFPDIAALAEASHDEVMSYWAGLGYYARARNAHRCAQVIHQEMENQFPQTVEELMELPGIGRTTAGAIVAQAFGRRAIILDGNVKRVLARYRAISGWPGRTAVQKQLWSLADELTPQTRSVDYTQAIMDLGALLCTRQSPRCNECPVAGDCMALQQGSTANYPERKKAKSLPTKKIAVFLCHQQEARVLLERRPPSGIWGGLWSLPECDVNADPHGFLEAQYGLTMKKIKQQSSVMHSFTHYHLYMEPYSTQVDCADSRIADDTIRWCNLSEVQDMGLPKPIAGLVTRFLQQESGATSR